MKWLYAHIADIPANEYDRLYAALSPSRRARVDRLKQSDDRKRSLAGEWLLKKLLRDAYGITDVVLETAPNGRPLLADSALYVSIAHSDGAVVCAVSDTPVGIDIERIRPIDLRLARRVCVAEEAAYLFGHAPTEADMRDTEDVALLTRFFEIWTAKEAYFKRCGTGITELKSVNILPLKRQIFHRDGYLIQIIDE